MEQVLLTLTPLNNLSGRYPQKSRGVFKPAQYVHCIHFFFFELLSQDNDSDDTHPSLHQEFNEETYIEALYVIPSWDIN